MNEGKLLPVVFFYTKTDIIKKGIYILDSMNYSSYAFYIYGLGSRDD